MRSQCGWEQASRQMEKFVSDHLWPRFDNAQRALMRSQCGWEQASRQMEKFVSDHLWPRFDNAQRALMRSQCGWEQASRQMEKKFVSDHLWPRFDNAQRALMRSQCGPLASAALTALPISRATRVDPQPFRLFLCRRLHLPLSLSHRTCRCGRQLDQFGHHRAACPEAGVLGKRGFPLECAAAQVCREGGARVSTNVFVRDMDLAVHNALDSRRLEVVADGLTLWRGAQLIDTTMVSPHATTRHDGTTRPRGRST